MNTLVIYDKRNWPSLLAFAAWFKAAHPSVCDNIKVYFEKAEDWYGISFTHESLKWIWYIGHEYHMNKTDEGSIFPMSIVTFNNR